MHLGALSWKSRNGKLRLLALLLGAALVWSVLAPVGSAKRVSLTDLCGPNDTPETGIQGDMSRADQEDGTADQGYNCGLMVVGHNDLDGLGGGAIAWADHCVFTATRQGDDIKVIDMSDPTDPVVIDQDAETEGHQDLPSSGSSENMHAVVTKDRAVLAYGPGIYDISDCEHPVPKGEITYTDKPIGSPHNVKLSPDGTKMVGTMPLTIADITDLEAETWPARYFQCEVAKQVDKTVTSAGNYCMVVQPKDYHALTMPRPQLAHEPEFNADGTRLYIAGQRQSDVFDQDVPGVFQRDEYMTVLDMTGDMTDPAWPKVLGTAFGAGHGINSIKIGGEPYLLHSNEGGSPGAECKPDGSPNMGVADQNAAAYLTRITNEPETETVSLETVSTMSLDINKPEPDKCAAQIDSNLGETCRHAASAASRGCVSTVHYQNVDNAAAATFAMLSMTSAGLRIWDIRDPDNPREVAYWSGGQAPNEHGCTGLFLAGGVSAGGQCEMPAAAAPEKVYDPIGAYAHYDAATGYIWVNTRASGFWVLKLEPQVRDALDLPKIKYPKDQPTSAPAKPPSL